MQDRPAPVGVAAEVLAYLCSHPNAADTLEGIMNWWLPRQRYETERQRVEQALDQLVAHGLIVKHQMIDDTILYLRGDGHAYRSDESQA